MNFRHYFSSIGICSAVLPAAALMTSSPRASAAEIGGCMASTGYAMTFYPTSGLSLGQTKFPHVSATEGVSFCEPFPLYLQPGVFSEFGTAEMDYAVGTGASLFTMVSALPTGSAQAAVRASLTVQLTLQFRLVRLDDALDNLAPVTFDTRLDFGDVIAAPLGQAAASNVAHVYHVVSEDPGELRASCPPGVSACGWTNWWRSGVPEMMADTIIDRQHAPGLLRVDRPYAFDTYFEAYSVAVSQPATMFAPNPGSAKASLQLAYSFAAHAPEGYAVVFDYVEALGLAPPALGDPVPLALLHPPIPEPETYVLMLMGLGLVGCVARRNRRLALGRAPCPCRDGSWIHRPVDHRPQPV